MKRGFLFRVLGLVCTLLALFAVVMPAEAGSFVVNAADDVDDGSCDDSHCSLREAINAANANPGADSITFDIPGPIPHVIPLTDILTVSDDQTTIDGSSQPGFAGSPVIVLDGGGTICRGMWIASNDNVVAGLSFVRFNCATLSAAIHIWGGVLGGGEGNLIENNYIGIDASGAPAGNNVGVLLWDSMNTVRGNVISGHHIGIEAADERQVIEGNRIGTDPSGMVSSGGYVNSVGIELLAGSDYTRIGGADPSERNLISGNGTGIEIESDMNEVFGNFIGTDSAGNAAIYNVVGISVDGNSNQIGGPNPGEGNTISGSVDYCGLRLDGSLNEVFGNKIGTDSSGMTSVPNGIGIVLSGTDNVIGGSASGEGNLISGNDSHGILFYYTGENNRAIGNMIGTTIDGASPLGNYRGVAINVGSHGFVIGGLGPNEGNLIAFNTTEGILVIGDAYENSILGNTIHTNGTGIRVGSSLSLNALRNSISRNNIYDNAGLGIDLDPPGVTPNDPGDADIGANALLNFPEITSASSTSVSGTACAGCVVELFISDQDPSGYGEGRTYIDSTTADASGNFSIPVFFPIVTCTRVTATATDASGNTSEFSENQRIGLCLIIAWPWLVIFLIGMLGLGAIGGRYAGRVTALSPGVATAVGTLIGVILGAGLLALAALLPAIQIEFPQEPVSFGQHEPMCVNYLEPDGFSPENGDIFEEYEDPRFEWSITDSLPEGQIRWRIDLLGPENLELSQTTSETSLLFSTFGESPIAGRRYHWRVVGEKVGEAGSFEPFCTPTIWRSFRLGSLPHMEGPPEMCIYTAIRNPICRQSDYAGSEQIAVLQHGESAELIALNPELTHGQFLLASAQQCWISMGVMEGPEDPQETCDVPLAVPEPPPVPDPCRPEMDQQACEASGGIWPEGATGAPSCICP